MKHNCQQCGREFHARPGRAAKYCSNNCRQAAFRGTPAGTRLVRLPIAVLDNLAAGKGRGTGGDDDDDEAGTRKGPLHCSFCDKPSPEVFAMIEKRPGSSVAICDECVALGSHMVAEKRAGNPISHVAASHDVTNNGAQPKMSEEEYDRQRAEIDKTYRREMAQNRERHGAHTWPRGVLATWCAEQADAVEGHAFYLVYIDALGDACETGDDDDIKGARDKCLAELDEIEEHLSDMRFVLEDILEKPGDPAQEG
jgi:hypothetical protein